MKKVLAIFLALSFLAAGFIGEAQAWQGRMEGMGDPTGLIYDDSDMLVHPSKIADGTGIEYFAHYKFLYRDVMDWNWDFAMNGPITSPFFDPINAVNFAGAYRTSGNEIENQALIGAALPVGTGRLGFFFTYGGKSGEFDGTETLFGSLNVPGSPYVGLASDYELNSSFNDFAGKIIYGVPIGAGFKFGAEVQLAYRQEENETLSSLALLDFNGNLLNVGWAERNDFLGRFMPFMMPYDSSYWELSAKTGITGMVGPASFGVTARGGSIVSSENKWDSAALISVNEFAPIVYIDAAHAFAMDGDVEGYKVGGDIWLRYPVDDCLALPFLFKIDYMNKQRSGDGPGAFSLDVTDVAGATILSLDVPLAYAYDSKEEYLGIEVGGGLDYNIPNGWRLGAGLYYAYMQSSTDMLMSISSPAIAFPLNVFMDYNQYPEATESQLKLKLTAEKPLSPVYTLRAGFNAFYGWVTEDYSFSPQVTLLDPPGVTLLNTSASLSGTRWGILGAVGLTAKFQGVTFEPFVQGGYQSVSLDDDDAVTSVLGGAAYIPWSVEKERNEALVGAGLSVRF